MILLTRIMIFLTIFVNNKSLLWKGNIKGKHGYFLITLYFNISFCNEFLIKVVDGTWVISIVYKKHQTTFQINITWLNNISLSRIRYCVVISFVLWHHIHSKVWTRFPYNNNRSLHYLFFLNHKFEMVIFSNIFKWTRIYDIVPFLSRMNQLAYRWI